MIKRKLKVLNKLLIKLCQNKKKFKQNKLNKNKFKNRGE